MPARGLANKQLVGQTLEAAFGTAPAKRIQIIKEIASLRGTSWSAHSATKTKGDPKGKSVLHICYKLFNILLGSNALQWCIKFPKFC